MYQFFCHSFLSLDSSCHCHSFFKHLQSHVRRLSTKQTTLLFPLEPRARSYTLPLSRMLFSCIQLRNGCIPLQNVEDKPAYWLLTLSYIGVNSAHATRIPQDSPTKDLFLNYCIVSDGPNITVKDPPALVAANANFYSLTPSRDKTEVKEAVAGEEMSGTSKSEHQPFWRRNLW